MNLIKPQKIAIKTSDINTSTKMDLEQLRAELLEVVTRLQASEEKLEVLTNIQQADEQQRAFPRTPPHEDITATIQTGDQIQLDSYKCIPEFKGEKSQYRSWRNQVTRRMSMIEEFINHSKYEAALGIIRAKITGPASDTLTNYKTAYNIDAIIERLDSAYSDQRPLYIVESEMTSIKQRNKTLQEYYDAVNQALNMVISKIVLAYKLPAEQKALVEEARSTTKSCTNVHHWIKKQRNA